MARPEWTLSIAWHERPFPEPMYWNAPELTVSVQASDSAYVVSVEMCRDADGAYVTGVAVRQSIAGGRRGLRTDISARDVQRLPLAGIIRAALATGNTAEKPPTDERGRAIPEVNDLGQVSRPLSGSLGGATSFDLGDDLRWVARESNWAREARAVLVPRGRPQHGHAREHTQVFYKGIADAHREFAKRGVAPVPAIAKRKRVPANTVHQWVHRARVLGFLEPSPRSRRKDGNDGE